MDSKELKEILDNHQHWLNQDCIGWENMRADLRDAGLRDANLKGADLRDANLRGADLQDANLRGADLRGADLYGADLYCANLEGVTLRRAKLQGINLRGANLKGANLKDADLIYSDLRGTNLMSANLGNANLRGADLSYCNLYGAYLTGANINEVRGLPPCACPDSGSFIGYKKARGSLIVELEILPDAKRSSATTRKCRCDKAKVLSIQHINGSPALVNTAYSMHDLNFVYEVGKIIEEPDFDEDRWNECAKGIHFFINRQDAVNY